MVRTIAQLSKWPTVFMSGFLAFTSSPAKADVNGLHITKDADGFLITQNLSDAKVDGFINSMRFDASGLTRTVKLIAIGEKVQAVEFTSPSLEEISSTRKVLGQITYTACSKLSTVNEQGLGTIIGSNIAMMRDYIDGIYQVRMDISKVIGKKIDGTFSYHFQHSRSASCNAIASIQVAKTKAVKDNIAKIRFAKLSGKLLNFLKHEKVLTFVLMQKNSVTIPYPTMRVASVNHTIETQALRFSALTDAQPALRIAGVPSPATAATPQTASLIGTGSATTMRFAAHLVPVMTATASATSVALKEVAGPSNGIASNNRFAAAAQVMTRPPTAAARKVLLATLYAIQLDSGLIAPQGTQTMLRDTGADRAVHTTFGPRSQPVAAAFVVAQPQVTATVASPTLTPAQQDSLARIQAMLQGCDVVVQRALYAEAVMPTYAAGFHKYVEERQDRALVDLVMRARADAIKRQNTTVLHALDRMIVATYTAPRAPGSPTARNLAAQLQPTG